VAPTALAYDEFGNPEPGTSTTRYGWLGGKQRSSETVTGATLMGARLYDPTLGRFLQTDSVPGGSANAYDYCTADPINCYNLNGQLGWHRHHYIKRWWRHSRGKIGRYALHVSIGLGRARQSQPCALELADLGACSREERSGVLPEFWTTEFLITVGTMRVPAEQ
jgi:RHS repeat-associated protein